MAGRGRPTLTAKEKIVRKIARLEAELVELKRELGATTIEDSKVVEEVKVETLETKTEEKEVI